LRQNEEAVLIGLLHVGQPLWRNTAGEKFALGRSREQRRLRRRCTLHLYVFGNCDLLYGFAQFHQLGRSGPGMHLEFAAARPIVGFVVMIGVTQQKTRFRSMRDQSKIQVYAGGLEITVFRFIDAVELLPRLRR
jgi:hypothetical protein